MVLETKTWVLGVLIATGASLLLSHLRWQNKETNVYVVEGGQFIIKSHVEQSQESLVLPVMLYSENDPCLEGLKPLLFAGKKRW